MEPPGIDAYIFWAYMVLLFVAIGVAFGSAVL